MSRIMEFINNPILKTCVQNRKTMANRNHRYFKIYTEIDTNEWKPTKVHHWKRILPNHTFNSSHSTHEKLPYSDAEKCTRHYTRSKRSEAFDNNHLWGDFAKTRKFDGIPSSLSCSRTQWASSRILGAGCRSLTRAEILNVRRMSIRRIDLWCVCVCVRISLNRKMDGSDESEA